MKWKTTPLSELANVIRGVTFAPSEASTVFMPSTTPVMRAGNIQSELITDADLIFVPNYRVKNIQLIKKNDIAMCMSSGSSKVVGKIAYATNDYQCTLGAFCSLIRPDSTKIYPLFLYFVLSAPLFQVWSEKASGANIKNIKMSELQAFQIPLPPLGEQCRIATILGKADAICRKRQEALKLADAFVKSVFLEMFGDPVLNPKGWEVKPLDRLASIVSGVTKGRDLREEGVEVPYMRVANVKDGYIDLSEIKTIFATKTEIEQYRLAENDILLTEGGDPDKLGRGAIWQGALSDCIHQNHIFRVRITCPDANSIFFAEYLKHQKAKMYFFSCAKQTTGIASINMRQLKSLPVLLPPLPLQNRFAKIVQRVEAHKQRLKAHLAEAEQIKKALQQLFFG